MPKQTFLLSLITLEIALLQSCKQEEESSSNQDWISLFNAKDLSGWTPKIKGQAFGSDTLNTFKAEDSILMVSYSNYGNFDNRFGHLFYNTEFSNYRFKLEYRFVGNQATGGEAWAEKNSGIMIHCQDPKTMELNQDFPNSLEVQLLGGVNNTISRPTGNLCTPGTHVNMEGKLITEHCITADAPTIYGEDWVQAEVVVYSDSLIIHKINNKEVIRYTQPILDLPNQPKTDKTPLKKGYISLQSESHPVEFKNIKIKEIK